MLNIIINLNFIMKKASYIFGFLDKDGKPYDYHISDDMSDRRTWESIDFKFSLPASKYILVWRRDRKNFTKRGADHITEYVKDDMEEYMTEGSFDSEDKIGEEGSQTKIVSLLLPSKKCLVLAYDRLILPEGNIDWGSFTDTVSFMIDEMVDEASQGFSDSEAIEDVLMGEEIKSPILENYRSRTTHYTEYSKPSDRILKEVYNFIKKGSFDEAASHLSGFYDISPPTIKIKTGLVGSAYVFYDVVNATLFIDTTKIPEFWLQLPAFLMGFFRHISNVNKWSFGTPETGPSMEKVEAERFGKECINRLLELNLDPRKET